MRVSVFQSDLLQHDGLSVELVRSVGSLLYLGRDGEAQSGQLPDFPQQTDQPVRVLDLQPAVSVVQLHHSAAGLKAAEKQRRTEGQSAEPGNNSTMTLNVT